MGGAGGGGKVGLSAIKCYFPRRGAIKVFKVYDVFNKKEGEKDDLPLAGIQEWRCDC